MNIAVFGANGPTGRLIVESGLASGHTMTAVTRHPDDFPLAHNDLRVITADVYDEGSLDVAVSGQDAVLSVLGVPFGRKPVTVYSVGVANILAAMQRRGVRRLAVVSSSAVPPESRMRDTGGGFFFERVLKPIIENTLGRTLYADMLRMERLVAASDVDWTIVRPSGLFGTAAVTDYSLAEDFLAARFTSRADLADVMLRQATETAWIRKAVAVATNSEQPSVMQLIRGEALSK